MEPLEKQQVLNKKKSAKSVHPVGSSEVTNIKKIQKSAPLLKSVKN